MSGHLIHFQMLACHPRRFFMRWQNGDRSAVDYGLINYWQGVIAGLSSVFSEKSYKYNVCYPKQATLGQLAEIAAQYVIDHPEKRADSLNLLICH